MLFNKKSSLEISIQAIVIVVLAMTLLGLGLGFIKGMFKNITDVSTATFDQIKDQLQRDLVNSNQKLIFSQTKINLERGKSVLLGWGIRNEGSLSLDYWPEFRAIKCPGTCPNDVDLNDQWFAFKYATSSDAPYSVDAADQQVERVELSIPKNADPGLYLIELSVYPDPTFIDPYAKTDLFVTVS